jgi:hypothetical protein
MDFVHDAALSGGKNYELEVSSVSAGDGYLPVCVFK